MRRLAEVAPCVYERSTILYRRYTKGVPFLSKMVYKRVRNWASGRTSPPPPGKPGNKVILHFLGSLFLSISHLYKGRIEAHRVVTSLFPYSMQNNQVALFSVPLVAVIVWFADLQCV